MKKFELYYGSYFGSKEELVWKDGRLIYRLGDFIPDREIVIHADQKTWESFLSAIQPVVSTWKRNYGCLACDGLTWSVEIDTDTFKVNSGGVHHFPEHYDTFLHHVRRILRCRRFAKGHSQKAYLVTGQVPHLINRKIRHFMRRKRRTLQELADCLGYPKYYVRIQLNARSPFELEDLRKIAWFLDLPLMDLLDECDFLPRGKSEPPMIFPSIDVGSPQKPVTNFKRDLPNLLVIDPERMS